METFRSENGRTDVIAESRLGRAMAASQAVRGAVIAVAATFLATSCQPADDGPAVTRVDDNGVEVVTSTRPAWSEGEGWTVSAEPDLVIGEDTDDLDYVFSFVRGPASLADGTIVVGDYATRQLRFFDRGGTFLRATGGQGQGPGELGVIADVMRCGDAPLYVLDGMRYEVNVVGAAGEFGRRDLYEVNAGVSLLYPIHCNDAGQLFGHDFGGQLSGDRQTGFHRSRVRAWLLDPRGFPLQDFGEFPGVELFEHRGRTSRHPFGKRVALELGNDAAYIGTADDFAIEVYALDGRLVRRIRRPFEDSATSRSDFDRYVDADSVSWPSDQAEEYRLRYNAMPLPDTYPAYEMFALDSEQHLWVQHFPRPDETEHTWSVFDPSGAWLGELQTPAGLYITEIGADHVLGVYRDELAEESVRRYALRR